MSNKLGYSITQYRGTWKVRVRDPYTMKYKTKHFRNRKDGETWAKGLRVKFQARQATTEDITLDEAGEMYIEHCKQLGRSAGYIRGITVIYQKAVAFGIRSLGDPVVPGRTQGWLASLKAQRRGQREPQPASERTKNSYLNVLRTIGNFAFKRQRLLRNPFSMCDRFREPQHVEEVYPLDDLMTIVDPKFSSHPWWLFAVLVAYTGMRSTEARKADWRWFRWNEDLIIIPAEVTKTLADRMVPLQAELKAILMPMAEISGPVFDLHISDSNVGNTSKAFAEYLAHIGLVAKGRVVHRLRHCCASLLTATGVQPFLAMEYVGHLDVRTAQRYSKGAKHYVSRVKGWPVGEFRLQRVAQHGCAAVPTIDQEKHSQAQ